MTDEQGRSGTWGELWRIALAELWPALALFVVGIGFMVAGELRDGTMFMVYATVWITWSGTDHSRRRIEYAMKRIDSQTEEIAVLRKLVNDNIKENNIVLERALAELRARRERLFS